VNREESLRPVDEEGVMKDKEEEEDTRKAVRPKIRNIADEPTDKEIEEHYMHHAEFRQWSPHCVKGKAVSCGHRSAKKVFGLPTVSIDYMFMADKQNKGEEKGMPILVMKDRATGLVWARVVPAKGVCPYAVKKLARQIDLMGHKKIVFKSDGEAAIKSVEGSS